MCHYRSSAPLIFLGIIPTGEDAHLILKGVRTADTACHVTIDCMRLLLGYGMTAVAKSLKRERAGSDGLRFIHALAFAFCQPWIKRTVNIANCRKTLWLSLIVWLDTVYLAFVRPGATNRWVSSNV